MASSVTVTALRERFTEFTEALYPDAQVENAINDMERVAGRLGLEAQLYCTAHWLTLEGEKSVDADGRPVPDGGSGVVVSERIGPRSVSYASPDGRKFYERTYYGRAFLELSRASPRRMLPTVIG